MIKIEDFDFDNILLDEKLNENILIYDVLYKTLFFPRFCFSVFYVEVKFFVEVRNRLLKFTSTHTSIYLIFPKIMYKKVK